MPEKLKAVRYAGAAAADAAAPTAAGTDACEEGIRRARRVPRLERTGRRATSDHSCCRLAGDLTLQSISNRGVKVFPGDLPGFVYSDLWNCRFLAGQGGSAVTHAQTVALQQRITGAGFDVVKTEGLYTFDGQRGYSLGQGE